MDPSPFINKNYSSLAKETTTTRNLFSQPAESTNPHNSRQIHKGNHSRNL